MAVLPARQPAVIAIVCAVLAHASTYKVVPALAQIELQPARATQAVAQTEASPANADPAHAPTQTQGPPVPEMGKVVDVLKSLQPEGWTTGAFQVSGFWDGMQDRSLSPQSAALLREFQCTGIASRFFQRGQRLVIARIYRFITPQGAYGAYTTMREGASSGVTLGDASSEDDQSISTWQGDYYLSVYTTAEDDDEAKALVTTLANKLVAGISDHAEVPPLVASLPRLDRIHGSERLFMGPVGARRSAPIPYIADLGVERSLGGASADYSFREPAAERLKLFVIDYGDAQAAQIAYQKYVGSLSEDHEIKESDNGSLFKTANGYLLCLHQGARMQIISGARKKFSPNILARQLTR